MSNLTTIIVGGILLVLAFLAYVFPVNDSGYSIPQANDLCNSAMGSLAQLFEGFFGSSQITQKCLEIRYMTYGIYGVGLIGLILVIVGAVVPSKY